MNVRKTALLFMFLIACDDKKEAPPTPAPTASAAPSASAASNEPTEIAAQHILVAWKGARNAPSAAQRTKAQAKQRADEIDEKAKSGEDFGKLAQAFSDDLGTRDRQGNLGVFTRDKMVAPFSNAAFALSVGAISDVVETPFGYHIIKRNQ